MWHYRKHHQLFLILSQLLPIHILSKCNCSKNNWFWFLVDCISWSPESSWSLFQSYIYLEGASSFLHYGQCNFLKITLKEVVGGNSALSVLNFRQQFGPCHLRTCQIMFLFEDYKFYHGTYFKEMSFSSQTDFHPGLHMSLETISAVSFQLSSQHPSHCLGAVEDMTSYKWNRGQVKIKHPTPFTDQNYQWKENVKETHLELLFQFPCYPICYMNQSHFSLTKFWPCF